MHYPTHERQGFLEWVEAGFPDTATIEQNYEPVEISATGLCRSFMLPVGCSDVMPGHACDSVAGFVGYEGDASGMTYHVAAATLLCERVAGDGAGADFLRKLFAHEA